MSEAKTAKPRTEKNDVEMYKDIADKVSIAYRRGAFSGTLENKSFSRKIQFNLLQFYRPADTRPPADQSDATGAPYEVRTYCHRSFSKTAQPFYCPCGLGLRDLSLIHIPIPRDRG